MAGLDLSERDAGYKSLTGQKLADNGKDRMRSTYNMGAGSPRQLVTPYNPGQSRVVNMLHGSGASLMPPDRPLAQADIELVEAWILKGAAND